MDEVDDGQDDPYDDYIMDQIPQDYKFISSDRDFQLPFEQYKNIDVARYESSPDDGDYLQFSNHYVIFIEIASFF